MPMTRAHQCGDLFFQRQKEARDSWCTSPAIAHLLRELALSSIDAANRTCELARRWVKEGVFASVTEYLNGCMRTGDIVALMKFEELPQTVTLAAEALVGVAVMPGEQQTAQQRL